jgi:uncharacterized membrane protein YdjX (TVP38/TMEM64 family)
LEKIILKLLRRQTMQQTENNNKTYSKIAILVLVLICIACYFFVPSVKTGFNEVMAMLGSGDFDVVEEFIDSYGPYAMAISFLLMILQSIIAPIPAFLITIANANLFGWWQGAILSWSSAMAGAAICFYISRILGRDIAIKLNSKKSIEQVDEFLTKYGTQSIMIARLLPFMSFDLVSYAAGLTGMGFWEFFIATGIGQLPATIVYSYVGGMLTGGAKLLMTGLLILFALSIVVFVMKQVYDERQKRNKNEEQ